jgi:hypothetical protein
MPTALDPDALLLALAVETCSSSWPDASNSRLRELQVRPQQLQSLDQGSLTLSTGRPNDLLNVPGGRSRIELRVGTRRPCGLASVVVSFHRERECGNPSVRFLTLARQAP